MWEHLEQRVDCNDIDDLIGSIRRKVVKGSKPTRRGRLRSCLRMLDGKGSDMGKSVFEQAVESFRGTPSSRSTLGDAIARFRGLSEANVSAPAVSRETPGGKQKSAKSSFTTGDPGKAKNYEGSSASVKGDAEPKKGSEGTGADGREKVDIRAEDHWGGNDSADVLFAEQMLQDKVGFMPSMEQQLAEQEAESLRKMSGGDPDKADLMFVEQNMSAPAVSRETPGGAQKSAKSRFRQGYKGPGKKYDGKPASIPADKEPMDAAANVTDGVDGEGYGADGREEVDVRGE